MMTIKPNLRVLIVEDYENDALLILEKLEHQGGYQVTSERVQTEAEMRRSLAKAKWDLVISDYTLPSFSGPAALGVLKESRQDLPFILVSGTIGEETAVEMLKAGAHDFVLKNNLVRLVQVVKRELQEARVRQEKREAEKALLESEARFRQVVESNMIGIVFSDRYGNITDTNDAFLNMLGYDRDEVLSGSVRWINLSDRFLQPDEESFRQSSIRWVFKPFRHRLERKDGQSIEVLIGGTSLEDDPRHAYVCFALDSSLCSKVESTGSHEALFSETLPFGF